MTLMQTCLTYLFGVANVSKTNFLSKYNTILNLIYCLKQYHEQWSITYRDVKNRVYSIIMYHFAKTLSEVL
jgi:hypothetical protein